MWPKNYKDYPVDSPLKKYQVKTGKGIVGSEMHDLNGWSNEIHIYKPRKKSRIRKFFESLFKSKKSIEEKKDESSTNQ